MGTNLNLKHEELETNQEDDCTIMLAIGRPSGDGSVIVAKNRDVATVKTRFS